MEKNEVHFDQEEVVKEKLEEIRKAASRIVDFLFPSATEQEKHIREGADQEARLESITLDSHGLTPGMRDFCLVPAQRTLEAFNTILHDFQAKISPFKEKMTALENYKNNIDELQNQTDSLEVQAEKEVGSDHQYKEAKEDYEKYKQQYDTVYCQKGQMHAKDFPLWLYLFLLFGIGVVEAAMNYFAILEQYGLPAFAAGLTIAIGAAVAYASHKHGTLLKQWEHYFGGAVEIRQKRPELIWVGVATVMLFLSLVFVGWTRYQFAMAELSRVTQSSTIIGGSGGVQVVNVVQSVLMTLIANILVYFIGAAIAYGVHDKDPDYTTRKQEMNKATARWNTWQAKIGERKKVIRALLTKKMAEQRNLSEALAKRYKPLFDEHEKVVEKERKIRHEADVFFNSLVNEYKNRFESNAKAMNQGINIIHNGNMLTVADYAGMRLAEDYFAVLANR